jgi:NAD(P)-dependent dehydrogenase (short-subunit alcohol dehydrogenase family)
MSSVDMTKFDVEGYMVTKPYTDLNLLKSGGLGPDGKPAPPQQRMGQPQDQANVLLFLLSDLAAEINGAVLPVDNAWAAA